MRMIERGTAQWFEAWKLLKARILGDNVGKSINNYMLMCAQDRTVYFKHTETRQTITVTLP